MRKRDAIKVSRIVVNVSHRRRQTGSGGRHTCKRQHPREGQKPAPSPFRKGEKQRKINPKRKEGWGTRDCEGAGRLSGLCARRAPWGVAWSATSVR